MNKDKREREKEPDYPVELETQFVMRLPEEPARTLREVLQTGDLKNRLTIQLDDDMRRGMVNFDQWTMHGKIVDLPTIVESLKTIDNKSFYKTADVCQMMLCKEEPDQSPSEEENPVNNKKKDIMKVDKKFLWPHGITPPIKNARKRRFRKTLKKKSVEAPEIERQVKRLLRSDNEAESFTWEIIQEDEDSKPETTKIKDDKKTKKSKSKQSKPSSTKPMKLASSNVVDIFGGAVSDSDKEDQDLNSALKDSHLSDYNSHQTGDASTNSSKKYTKTEMINLRGHRSSKPRPSTSKATATHTQTSQSASTSGNDLTNNQHSEDTNIKLLAMKKELDGLKQQKRDTQQLISEMENVALRQRFEDHLHTLNQNIMYKEMVYQGLLALLNEDV